MVRDERLDSPSRVVRVMIVSHTLRACTTKNSAETRWRIEPQGLLKDSPLCDDSTPIPPHRCRRLDEPTPAGCDRIPPGRKSHSAGTTRWQAQALHRRSTHPAGAQNQTRRPTPPGEITSKRHQLAKPFRPEQLLTAVHPKLGEA